MRVLVLGGTGAMGISLVRILAERGDEVRVTSRSKRHSSEHISYLQGDALHDEAFLKSILREPSDAIIDFMVYRPALFQQRLPMLLSATKQYFFFSSSRVYADAPGPITEESPRLLDACPDKEFLSKKESEYALYKAMEEDCLRTSGQRNWTIIRPYITYNANRLQLGVLEKEQWLYRALKGKKIVFQRDIAQHITTMSYGYDVARVIVGLIGREEAKGETIHIASPEPICWQRVLEIYLDTLERVTLHRPEVLYLDDSTQLARVMGNWYQVAYDRMFDRVFDESRAKALFGGEIGFISPEDGLPLCLEDFLRGDRHMKVSWLTEGYMDRLTGEKTKFLEIPSWRERIKYSIGRFAPPLAIHSLRARRKLIK